MTFLAPGYLVAGALAALGVLVLHLIVTREPHTRPLPTARFAPDTTALARPRAVKPRDLLLLALRALTVLLAGAALARPILQPARTPLLRIVLADSGSALPDSLPAGDTLIHFHGGISSALVRGLRAASGMQDRADSIAITLVSPVLASQIDAATDSIRALWPGAIRVVRLPVPAAVPGAEARIAWAAIGSRQSAIVRGVTAGEVTVVAAFDSVAPLSDTSGIVVARWMDGSPAAIEKPEGAGCVRIVAIPVPQYGDLTLTPRWRRLRDRLTAPCGGHRDLTPADPARVLALESPQRPRAVAAASIAPLELRRSSLGTWLLALAIALAVAELWVRKSR